MSSYGQTAIKAVELCGRSLEPDPVAAWAVAVREYCPTLEGQKKSCPRSTFLGLCEEGLVVGIPRGGYTRSRLNKSYALRAVKLLQEDESLAKDVRVLWQKVMSGENKQPNHQMDVVVALWQAEMLVGSGRVGGAPNLGDPAACKPMKVEILTFSDEVPRVLATWTLREGVAVCDVLAVQREAELDGLAVGGPKLLYPRDGSAFLEALPIAYGGSYCRARLISDSTRGHRERGRLGAAGA